MDHKRVVVTFGAAEPERALLRQLLASDAEVVFLDECPAAQRGRVLEGADVLVSWSFRQQIRPEDYPHLGRAKLVQLLSAGANHMPFAELPSHLIVASNPGAYATPMAEHVLAMVLALAKRLLVENAKLARGEFDQFTPNRLLCGATAGILGFGGIGRASARLLRALGMKIAAINTTGESPEPTDFIGTLADLEHVLRTSDVVVVSLPLTKATRGLIGERELGWMKPDAIVANVARGAIVDEDALYAHARNHPSFGVGIDAWWTEPFSDGQFRMEHPFLELPNVLGSPHNSAVVPGVLATATRQAAENVQRFLRGEPIRGIVRREDYV